MGRALTARHVRLPETEGCDLLTQMHWGLSLHHKTLDYLLDSLGPRSVIYEVRIIMLPFKAHFKG